ELVNFGTVSLPPRAVVDGAILDVSAITVALKRCMESCGVGAGSKVNVAVAGLRAITREIEMPNIPDSELDNAVKLQALDVIPFPPDKTLLSARPLSMFTAADGSTVRRVLLAAAHRDLVDPLLAALEAAGLVPVSVDLTSSALVRALASPATSPNGPEAIVSVGAGLTTVVIHEAGVPHFVRTIASGSDAVTAAIAATLDIPLGDAEATKRALDKPGPHIRVASAAANDATAQLIGEIKSSIDYYSTLPGRTEVLQVVVTGGGSKLLGFIDRLAQQFRIPVVPGSCLAKIDYSGLQMTPADVANLDPVAAVVIGLALPELAADSKPFNLVPPEIAVRARQKRTERLVLLVAVIIVIGLVGLGAWKFLQVRNAQNQVNADTTKVSQLNAEVVRLDVFAKKHAELISDQAIAVPLVDTEVYWPYVLPALAKWTPKTMTVTSFTGTEAIPAYISTVVGPGVLTAQTDKMVLPTPSNAIGSISISVTGKSLPIFKKWLDVFQNNATLTAEEPFLIQYFSSVTYSQSTGINFSATLAITGRLHTLRSTLFTTIPTTP
ncbi:MAG TPA: pilus assembly protein PilM, partial [Acidimicrobiales bacterium]|nr:pilus assembly protein PilM [Acidimicrobiales bacterium]